MQYAQATQALTPKNKVTRYAICPDHETRTSLYIGPQESDEDGKVYWLFKCRGKGGHQFLAIPDRTAPKNVEQVQGWTARKLNERIEPEGKRRK